MKIKVTYEVDIDTLYRLYKDLLPNDLTLEEFKRDEGYIRYIFSNELNWINTDCTSFSSMMFSR